MVQSALLNLNYVSQSSIDTISFYDKYAIVSFVLPSFLTGDIFSVYNKDGRYYIHRVVKRYKRGFLYELRKIDDMDFNDDDEKILKKGVILYRTGFFNIDDICK